MEISNYSTLSETNSLLPQNQWLEKFKQKTCGTKCLFSGASAGSFYGV